MATKKAAIKRRNVFIPFIIIALAVIAVLWLLTMQIRINVLEKSLDQTVMSNFMRDMNDMSKQRLAVNPEAHQAYIPSANLKMPYSSLISSLQYGDNSGEDLRKNGYVTLTTIDQAYKFDHSNSYGANGQSEGCYAAYVLSLNEKYDGDNVKELFTKTLDDGRKMTVLESTEPGCIPFTTGSSGQDIVKMLRKIQSY